MKTITFFLLLIVSISLASFAQPHMVKEIIPGTIGGTFSELTFMNGWTYFIIGTTPYAHLQLWRSDGTEDGTAMVKDFGPSSNTGNFNEDFYAASNNVLYFSVYEGTHGRELWKSDGTSAGTQMVKDINPGPGATSNPRYFAELNGFIYFSAKDGVHGEELWRTDGTEAGTKMMKDIRPGSAGSGPMQMTTVNGLLYFTASDSLHGRELWKTDGTDPGTQLVTEIHAGRGSSSPGILTAFNGQVYFYANNGTPGYELWKSDGTATGTQMVKEINIPGFPDPYSVQYHQLLDMSVFQGYLYFLANNGINGAELWKTDGTLSGTQMIKDINPGDGDSYPLYFTELNGELFFSAFHYLYGVELWKTDGTEAGTVLVKDINPGTGHGYPGPIIEMNGTLFFPAADLLHGTELWMSDGSESGTRLVADIGPGPVSSSAYYLIKGGGKLFFYAYDGIHGVELWVFEPAACAAGERKVYSFTLVDADNDTDIGTLRDGDEVDLSATGPVNVRANVCDDDVVESVKFQLNGVDYRTENIPFYTIAGDNNGNYNAWNVTPGAYTIRAIPYSADNATGAAGTDLSMTINVVQSGTSKTTAQFNDVAIVPSALQVFPNPNEGSFNISFTVAETADVKVEVYDLLGKTVYRDELHSFSGAYSSRLDLSMYGQGIYLLKVREGANTPMVKKITVNGN